MPKSPNSYLFVGDVHGHLVELEELLDKFLLPRLKHPNSKLIFVGDLVDRGPHSLEVVCRVRKLQQEFPGRVICLMGNHENFYVRYHRHVVKQLQSGSAIPMSMDEEQARIMAQLSEENLVWLAELPFYWNEGSVMAVHAGIPKGWIPDRNLKKIGKLLLHLRYVDRKGRPVTFGQETEADVHWSDLYDGSCGVVVYGHQPWDKIYKNNLTYGVDTGCCFGGSLSALELDAEGGFIAEYSVDAKTISCIPK